MRPDAFILLLPLVLAAHNAEEYVQLPHFAQSSGLPARLRSRPVVGSAMVLVTLGAAALAIAGCFTERPALLTAIRISIFALGWNALGHAALSLLQRTLIPGTRTAIVIILPYTAAAFVQAESRNSLGHLAALVLAGAAALPAIILVVAILAYALSRALDPVRHRAGTQAEPL